MTGPSLAEVWNRTSGSLQSFPRYSPALQSAGIVWNDDTLDAWIKDPQHFIPGNTMTFPGLRSAKERTDLLAFLKDATRPGRGPPSTAQGGNQMGGMTGMMGGGSAPNLKKLDPEDRVRSINHCGDTYKVTTPTERFATSGNGICDSRRMSVAMDRRKVSRPSCPPE